MNSSTALIESHPHRGEKSRRDGGPMVLHAAALANHGDSGGRREVAVAGGFVSCLQGAN